MDKITYTRAQIDAVGEEIIWRIDRACRRCEPMTHNERVSLLDGVYSVLCATAANLADAYRWLTTYENDILPDTEEETYYG